LVKSDQHVIGKHLISGTPFFQVEKFYFFEDSKNGPTIITLLMLPLSHNIGFCCDWEY